MSGGIAMGRDKSRACGWLARVTLCASVVLLGACSDLRKDLYPAEPPQPSAVFDDYSKFRIEWAKLGGDDLAGGQTDAVKAYVSLGYAMADRECLKFFTNLRKLRNDTDFSKDLARNLMASAGLISALSSAPTAVLAGLFGATGVVPSVVGDFQKTFLFAAAGDSLYPQISTAMARYWAMFPASGSGATVNRLTADMRVRQHAALCSLPFLTHVVNTGIKDLEVEAGGDANRAAPNQLQVAPALPSAVGAAPTPIHPPRALPSTAPSRVGTTTIGSMVLR